MVNIPKVESSKKNLPPLSKGAKQASNKPMSLQKPELDKSPVKSSPVKQLKNSQMMKKKQKLASEQGEKPVYDISN